MLLALCSCEEWRVRSLIELPQPTPKPTPPPPATMPGVTSLPTNTKDYTLLVQYHLMSIEVPIGTVSGSEELWSYLDEEKVSVERSTVLGRNGLRIGLAKANHWEDLRKILVRMTGRALTESTAMTLPGSVYPVTLKTGQAVQTIFVSHEDRTLSGSDYPAGDNAIVLSCTLNQDDPSMVMLTGVPQIRTAERQWQIVSEGGHMSMVAAPVVFSFEPLTFRLPLTSKDVIILGPGGEARRPFSLGKHFLIRQREGIDFETVIVLIPEVLAEPTKR